MEGYLFWEFSRFSLGISGFLASWLLAFVFLESGLFGFWLVAFSFLGFLAFGFWLFGFTLWPLWLWLSASSASPVTPQHPPFGSFGWWLLPSHASVDEGGCAPPNPRFFVGNEPQ